MVDLMVFRASAVEIFLKIYEKLLKFVQKFPQKSEIFPQFSSNLLKFEFLKAVGTLFQRAGRKFLQCVLDKLPVNRHEGRRWFKPLESDLRKNNFPWIVSAKIRLVNSTTMISHPRAQPTKQ